MEKTRDQDPNPHNNRCRSETLPVPPYHNFKFGRGLHHSAEGILQMPKKICNPGSEIFQTVDAVGKKLTREKRKEEKTA